MQSVRDWLQQPVILSEVLPYGILALLLAAALTAFARSTRRATHTRSSSGATRPEGFLARWFRTMRLGPGEDLLIRATFAAFALLFVMALGAAFVLVAQVLLGVFAPDNGQTPTASLGLGALLVALLGAPFLIWRTLVAQRTLEATHRQTDLQDEALFNDKINAAATDLAKRRQVTRVVGHGAQQRVLTEWQDDLVTRAAAIDRLEGLAREAIKDGKYAPAQRIARMLSVYVQELSREYPAKTPPEGASWFERRKWAATLRRVERPDMERAAQSLGRINPSDEAARVAFDPTNIDLRHCNLQGFDLHGINYSGAQVEGTKLQGTDLGEAQMQRANLRGAQMQGADLRKAKMQRANLWIAQMRGADLRDAQMQGASLFGAEMQGANLRGAQMQGAKLLGAQLKGANLSEAQMQGARLCGAKFEKANLLGAHMQGADLFEVQMQGARLRGKDFWEGNLQDLQMHGADLSLTESSEETKFTDASMRGAALRNVDETTLARLQPHWNEIIYFAKTLPDGAPAHWVQIAPTEFEIDIFRTQWRAWASTLDPPVTIAYDYRPD